MHPKFLKSMKVKKKRAVDPNAPPRPNLLSHDKKIRDMATDHLANTELIKHMKHKIERLERKLNAQSDYLQALHSRITSRK